ncbi:glyoxylase-like metal-dependent hydrolase (beta-lactamase superfamily II) [Mycolicibacterium sp. BK556]|uniref:MBL fold metallo-hydrolase n=1 Tax=unclassified Mycolicibacterium TaxID=2636767 RepID=UPI00160780CB|nr:MULTISPECIES: MBL fold metallo-hydrolase [unclassified Mycolicibacterium]MBB3603252.1 glyoxylase-like metal-dependent hydrolase (beta-lactamase superfamily II) [Mycolicibacterium sp. BK556]MBB3633447.1 glyoxylase-like metal-dependent hydrolase (beta-lactamase superfamily II) [Mycolicibacterium sp. BK607]
MKVHHLNCGSLGSPKVPLVCHVLLIESDNGLVLVDAGFGLQDCADPARLGPSRHLLSPVLDVEETAARQVERLGFRRDDVRHIITTHFDFDHIGGIADFPDAQIHVTAAEALGAMRPPSLRERIRFRSVQWAHGPKIVEHDPDGEKWRGFAAAKELTEIAPGLVLVSLPGHTRGHACVAVDTGSRWILHCGDAFYFRGTLTGTPVPLTIKLSETLIAFDLKRVRDNHARLAELYNRREPDLLVVSAHDPTLLAEAVATAT